MSARSPDDCRHSAAALYLHGAALVVAQRQWLCRNPPAGGVSCFRYMFFVLTKVIHLQRRERGLAGSPHALQAPRVGARVRNLRLRLSNERLQRAYKVCKMNCHYT